MKTQKASLLTKLVVLALLIGVATALLNLRGLIQQAQADLAEAQRQVTVQRQTNADLADAVETAATPTVRQTSPGISWVWWSRGRSSSISRIRPERLHKRSAA